MYSLKQLADMLGGRVHGDDSIMVERLATLSAAMPGAISFLANPKYIDELKTTKASAVLLTKEALPLSSVAAIVLDNPYLAFAKVAAIFDRSPKPNGLIHPTAVIAEDVKTGNVVTIGAHVVIGAGSRLGDHTVIGANTVISDNVSIGDHCEIKPNVTIYHDVTIGDNTIIHANTVIGSDGFGNAKDEKGNWVKIPQIGGVRIGQNVEIGASTTIDRGAIDDTVIADGVKIDNQIQIAHNVIIGENTAVAGSVGIAGSVKIGKNCLLGGQVGISGHLEICDNVILTAASNVSKNITEPGMYSGGFNAKPHMEWKRMNARLFKLDKLENRVKLLEKINTDK
ncbi:MAG: UDP-3-O-(3-hydroxymyristoyl)glucosamine N-acyltransferase [Francisellaceae bacterium]